MKVKGKFTLVHYLAFLQILQYDCYVSLERSDGPRLNECMRGRDGQEDRQTDGIDGKETERDRETLTIDENSMLICRLLVGSQQSCQ